MMIDRYSDLQRIEAGPFEYAEFVMEVNHHGVFAPDDVMRQFYFDHRANEAFLAQYGHLQLNRLKWVLTSIPISNFLDISCYPEFKQWVQICASRFDDEPDYRKAILHQEPVKQHWLKHGTWIVPPILFAPLSLSRLQKSLHLVEGHTRVGCLLGASRNGLNVATEHQVWLGQIRSD